MSETLHVYALSDRPVPETPRGAYGEALVQVVTQSLVAIAGAIPSPPHDDTAAALAHARVVDELAARVEALLPLRFGVRYRDVTALEAAVVPEEDRLTRALVRIRGCAEVSLSAIIAPDEAGPPPATGREYLERRLRETRRVDALIATVHVPLAARARDAQVQHAIAPPRFAASYLVSRADLDAFGRMADAAAAAADVALVRCGPWPPYSFTGEAA